MAGALRFCEMIIFIMYSCCSRNSESDISVSVTRAESRGACELKLRLQSAFSQSTSTVLCELSENTSSNSYKGSIVTNSAWRAVQKDRLPCHAIDLHRAPQHRFVQARGHLCGIVKDIQPAVASQSFRWSR